VYIRQVEEGMENDETGHNESVGRRWWMPAVVSFAEQRRSHPDTSAAPAMVHGYTVAAAATALGLIATAIAVTVLMDHAANPSTHDQDDPSPRTDQPTLSTT
jgi:hypothetical protein